MTVDEFGERVERVRHKLYKTALLSLGSEAMAVDALDEAVYKALRGYKKLRQPEYFDTWITRILINECHNEHRRRARQLPIGDLPEAAAEQMDALPLREAVVHLPPALREVVILRFFSGYTLRETAQVLDIPQGTVVTHQRKALALLRLELEEEGL